MFQEKEDNNRKRELQNRILKKKIRKANYTERFIN